MTTTEPTHDLAGLPANPPLDDLDEEPTTTIAPWRPAPPGVAPFSPPPPRRGRRGRPATAALPDFERTEPRRSVVTGPDGEPVERAKPGRSPFLVLLVLVSTIGILAYAGFLLNPGNRGDIIPYVLVIVAETVLVAQALSAMWTILAGGDDPRDFAFHRAQARLLDQRPDRDDREAEIRLDGRAVLVDVFITVYGEELVKIRATVEAAVAMRGLHRTWVLDDGRSDEVRDLAEELGAHYVRRLSSGGAKAGNVNHALSIAKGEYFAIFDADFVPDPEFLVETMPFFIDPGVAFVQTPQAYGNLDTTMARGAAYMQAVFYRFIQPGRNRFNAAICVGTNVVFRRRAIDEVGGICTDSKSEDVWTSLRLHERGWRSVFIPQVLAIGDAPETVEAFSKQQLRWATGGFEILLTANPLGPRRRLTSDQRLQYLVTATFYLTGICPLLLLIVPPLEIYFDLRPMNLAITPGTWLLYYCGFYVMQVVLAWFTLGSFRWETLTLATVSFPIYTKALLNVISGKEVGWHVTGGSGAKRSPFDFMVPQLLFLLFLALTSVVAINRDVENGVLTIATAWNVTNTLILGAFALTGLREARRLKRPDLQPAPVLRSAAASAEPRTVVARPADLAMPAIPAPASISAPIPAPTITVRRSTGVHRSPIGPMPRRASPPHLLADRAAAPSGGGS
ncbi:glycosyltransferase family 2 protein [Agromyces seonyuensis]|uniref:Glycosyltransferase n=1 Tax=Agromyces seonyuensis TaxID=2662446 RepID=A0A6I4NVP5_9MICO|nr:glycosyltransferase [Agromyces seonyuensis]MWB97182.1 glycosyltransferase [Agromyces seonyuensis]